MLLAGGPAAAQAPPAAHPQSLEELAARLRQLQSDLATLTAKRRQPPAGTATDGNAGTATSIEALRGELDELDQRIRVARPPDRDRQGSGGRKGKDDSGRGRQS